MTDRITNEGDHGSAAGEPLVRVRNLKKYYDDHGSVVDRLLGNETTAVKAVDGVSLDIYRGETLGLVGESGCGKSTTGETLLRLREATGGRVLFDGEAVFEMDGEALRRFRRRAGVVFQDPFSSLDPRMTAGAIVREPLRVHGIGTKADRRERAAELLERVGLSAAQRDRYPHEFSGGQRQRIGIARSLALEPEFLVLDEPVSALDVSVQAQILNLLADLQADMDLTYLFIAHDLSVVRHISDRVAVMYLGKVAEIGPADDLFDDPRHPYTKALLESVPRAATEEQGRRVETLKGDVPSPRNPPSGCRFRTRCPRVIPPEDMAIDQSLYRAIMDFRERIENRSIPTEQVRAEAVDGTDAAFVDALLDRSFDREPPQPHRSLLRDAAAAVADGDWEAAARKLRNEYAGVCETTVPVLQPDSEHPAACHLFEQPDDAGEADTDAAVATAAAEHGDERGDD